MPFQSLTGDVTLIQPSGVLRLAVLAPMASAAAAVSFRPRLLRSLRESRAVGVAGPLFAAAIAAMHAATLGGRAFVDGPLRLGRVGSIELALGLHLDLRAGLLALGASLLATLPFVQARSASDALDRAPRVGLALAGCILAVLADGPLAFGVGAVVMALAGLAGEPAPRAAGPGFAHASAVVATVSAFALAWGLGGSFGIRVGHEPDYTRRNPVPAEVYTAAELGYDAEADATGPELWPVIVGAPPAATATTKPTSAIPTVGAAGWVSLLGAPGGRLFLKGGAEVAGTSPVLRKEIASGFVDMEVEPRGGGRRVRFRAVQVPPGREIAIVPVGPTVIFREVQTELVLDDGAGRFVRKTLDPDVPDHRRVLGFPLVDLVVIGFGLSALLLAVSGGTPLGAVFHAIAAVALLSRVGGLGLPTRVGGVVALVLGLAGVVLAAVALLRRRRGLALDAADAASLVGVLGAAGAIVAPNLAALLVLAGLFALSAFESAAPGDGHALEARARVAALAGLALAVVVLGRAVAVALALAPQGRLAGLSIAVAFAALVTLLRAREGTRRKKKAPRDAALASFALTGLSAAAALLIGERLRLGPLETVGKLGQGAGSDLATTGLFVVAVAAAWVAGPRLAGAAADEVTS